MTSDPAQPARSSEVSAGAASDAKTFLAAALLTFSAGMLVLILYAFIGGAFGGLLGLIAAGFGIGWWNNLHGKVFPRDLPKSSMIGVAVTAVVLGLILYAMT